MERESEKRERRKRLQKQKKLTFFQKKSKIKNQQDNPDEVCPAGWTPGAATMKPTPGDSKEYFKAL